MSPSTDQTHRAPPVYLRSLELENVRCFGDRQELALTTDGNTPARWNILLGDNGVGKTTLLQCLAWMRPVPADIKGAKIEPALAGEENATLNSLLRIRENISVYLRAAFSIGASLHSPPDSNNVSVLTTEFKMQGKDGRLDATEPSSSDIGHIVSKTS